MLGDNSLHGRDINSMLNIKTNGIPFRQPLIVPPKYHPKEIQACVRCSVRCIILHLSSGYPLQQLFHKILCRGWWKKIEEQLLS